MLQDRKIALILTGIFVAFYVTSFQYPEEVVAFPQFLAYILLGLTILMFIFPEKKSEFNLKDFLSKEKILSVVLLISYVILFPIIGFFVTTFIFAVLYMWIFSKENLKRYVIVTVISLAVIYIVFQKVLYVWFPQGLLM